MNLGGGGASSDAQRRKALLICPARHPHPLRYAQGLPPLNRGKENFGQFAAESGKFRKYRSDSAAPPLFIDPHVVDHLAVVGQRARFDDFDRRAQLADGLEALRDCVGEGRIGCGGFDA